MTTCLISIYLTEQSNLPVREHTQNPYINATLGTMKRMQAIDIKYLGTNESALSAQ
jgi:hypothetical protein